VVEEIRRYFLIICVIGCLSAVFNIKIAIGWILGCLVAYLNFRSTVRFGETVMTGMSSSGHFMMNFLRMAAILAIAGYYHNKVNVFATAAGLCSIRLAIFIYSYKTK